MSSLKNQVQHNLIFFSHSIERGISLTYSTERRPQSRRAFAKMRHPFHSLPLAMKFTNAFFILCAASLCNSPFASAAAINPDDFVLQEWKIIKIHCPDCDKQVKSALQAQTGNKVKLGPTEFSGKLFDTCDGPTEVVLKKQARQEKLDEIKEVLGAEVKFNPATLQLPNEVVSASVFCQGTNGVIGGSGARILSIEDKRVLILYGEQAILELRK